jgi:group I intron endonuclease
MSGIYKITNLINYKVYIGKGTKISGRIASHKYLLRNNKHTNCHLQHAWNKYGEQNFTFETIEKCEVSILPQRESYWVEYHKSNNDIFGYNLMIVGRKNHHHSNETKKKISNASLGKKKTIEHRKNYTLSKYKAILQFDLSKNFIKEWLGASQIRDELGYNQGNITAVCNGKRISAHRYIWKYKN